MANVIVIGIVLVVVGAAVAYIVKAKKQGVKCIGCPSGCNCSEEGHSGCSCECHSDTEAES